MSFSLYFVELLPSRTALYEIIDSSAVVTRDAKRRGSAGYRVFPRLAGAIGSAGMKGCASYLVSILQGSSQALALPLPMCKTGLWQRPSSP